MRWWLFFRLVHCRRGWLRLFPSIIPLPYFIFTSFLSKIWEFISPFSLFLWMLWGFSTSRPPYYSLNVALLSGPSRWSWDDHEGTLPFLTPKEVRISRLLLKFEDMDSCTMIKLRLKGGNHFLLEVFSENICDLYALFFRPDGEDYIRGEEKNMGHDPIYSCWYQ